MKASVFLVGLCVVASACGGDTSTPSPTTIAATTTSTSESPATPASETPLATDGSVAAGPHAREVGFASGEVDLVGTLRLPAGEDLPGVLLIHGSGPNSRDAESVGQLNLGFGFTIAIFAEIAEALQEAGFAVLTYDKRSCGPFNGCFDNGYVLPGDDIVIDDFVSDAEAAVAFLREQPEIDPSQISIVGHSQGAEFVTVMLAADSQLASGAMLAGPFRPIDQITEFQLTSSVDLLESLGMSEEQALNTPGVASLAAMVDGLKLVREGGTEPVSGIPAGFWQSWLDLGQAKIDAVAGLRQPVLVLGGGFDWNVPLTEAEAWDELLGSVSAEHTTVILECVTHALNCVTETDVNSITADDVGEHVASEVLDALIGFLTM